MTESALLTRGQVDVVRLAWMLVTLVLALMTIFPLLWMLSISFKQPVEVFQPNLWPSEPTLDNFLYVLTEAPFGRYLLNSFIVSAAVTVIALFFHSMAGYALARLRFPGREAIFLAIFSTFLVSLPVIIVPLFILVRTLGMVNSYAGLIVPGIFNAFGIFLLRQYYVSLPRELEEAAIVDGASTWTVFWKIIFPLLSPMNATVGILTCLWAWNDFLLPLVIISDPDGATIQLAQYVFQSQFSADYTLAFASYLMAMAPLLIVYIFAQRWVISGVTRGAIK